MSALQFGQVGVGDNVDHCSPVQVKLPDEQVFIFVLSFVDFNGKLHLIRDHFTESSTDFLWMETHTRTH